MVLTALVATVRQHAINYTTSLLYQLRFFSCVVSSIHLVERPRNLYPTVALGANLSVTFTFTGSCSSSPDVVWAKTTSIEKNTTPARRLPGNETRYVATLRIVHASNKSYGVYGAYVCGKQLINFTVVYPSLGNTDSSCDIIIWILKHFLLYRLQSKAPSTKYHVTHCCAKLENQDS